MYRSFYQLREKPFSLLPDPAFLYISDKHRKALTKLRSGILNRAGMTLITGEIGAGKTTLIQHLVRELEGEVTIGLINNIHSGFDNLLEWVLQAFEIELTERSDAGLHRAFVGFVKGQAGQGRRALLFVDEAQNMSAQVLEDLRLLMNINVDHPSFQVVLAGQPELRDSLERPDMRQFAQRIAVEHHLRALDAQETAQYIQHRLTVAGGDPGLFNAEACERVYQRSQGIPRLINSLCDTVLEYGFEQQKHGIDGALVTEILDDGMHRQLLALVEPHYLSSGGGRVSALAKPVDGLEQDAPHVRELNHVPTSGYQPFAVRARSANVVRAPASGKRPGNLDAALKALSESLD